MSMYFTLSQKRKVEDMVLMASLLATATWKPKNLPKTEE